MHEIYERVNINIH